MDESIIRPAMTLTHDQIAGCLLGLAFGDALGAPYEGGFLERAIWRLIGHTPHHEARWTDDTQMALDLAESLLQYGDVNPDELARQFAASYRWSRGYGPGTARLLKRVRAGQHWTIASRAVYPDGSYGNGAAMRAPILALFFSDSRTNLIKATHQSSEVTHRHPLGIEGAVALAVATQALLDRATPSQVLAEVNRQCHSSDFTNRIAVACSFLDRDTPPAPTEVIAHLGNGSTASTSCITAIYAALQHLNTPFEKLIQFVISGGGDTDTIGAMAGALWGAANGSAHLPTIPLEAKDHLEAVASRIFKHLNPASA